MKKSKSHHQVTFTLTKNKKGIVAHKYLLYLFQFIFFELMKNEKKRAF